MATFFHVSIDVIPFNAGDELRLQLLKSTQLEDAAFVNRWNAYFKQEGVSVWGAKILCGHMENRVALEREADLEEVRASRFPHLPSRFQCLFGWETLKEAQGFRSRAKLDGCHIWVVAAQTFFVGDINVYEGVGIGQFKTAAVPFWRGEQTSPPQLEVMMRLPVRIIGNAEANDAHQP